MKPGQAAEVARLRAQARAEIGITDARVTVQQPTMDTPLVIRFDMTIRYARDMGWLAIRDPFGGEWHEVWAKDCPPSWRQEAYREKFRRQQGRR